MPRPAWRPGESAGAHEALEQVREVLLVARREAGMPYFLDELTEYHTHMEAIVVTLDTECDMVKKMAEEISFLEFRAPFATILHNPVYRSASKNLKHAACPVPSGILKAIEVELGVCLPRPVRITFEKKEEKG